jgi:hypothetical protein
MTIDDRTLFIAKLMEDCLKVLDSKGRAYSGNDEANANFIRTAQDSGLTKYQIWMVFFNKHKDSILNAIKDSPTNPHDATEGLRGRIIDGANYLMILASMLEEDQIL